MSNYVNRGYKSVLSHHLKSKINGYLVSFFGADMCNGFETVLKLCCASVCIIFAPVIPLHYRSGADCLHNHRYAHIVDLSDFFLIILNQGNDKLFFDLYIDDKRYFALHIHETPIY